MNKKSQRGLTLIEIIIAGSVLGLITIAMVPSFKAFATARQLAYEAEQTRINQKIANALFEDARSKIQAESAKLTAPCNNSTNRVFYSPLNTTHCSSTHTASFKARFTEQGLTEALAQSDVSGKDNIRMYQRVTVSDAVEVPFLSSETKGLITSYDIGVIYLTNCGRNQTCNQSASITNLPRSQPLQAGEVVTTTGAARLLSTNYLTWVPGTRDIGVVTVSTLPLQKELVDKTAERMILLRDALLRYVDSMRAANPTSSANFFPRPSNPAEWLPVASDPASNDRCREGWYILDEARYDILAVIGLGIPGANFEMGKTPWGGSIEYCRDYDPSLNSPHGSAPHFAALRVYKDFTSGLPPDAAFPENNVLISF